MQIKLPVDVHLAVGSDGKMVLLIGGLVKSCSPKEFADVLKSEPLAHGRRRVSREHPVEEVPLPRLLNAASTNASTPKLTKNGKRLGRPPGSRTKKKNKASGSTSSSQSETKFKNLGSSESVKKRSEQGLCSWCDRKPVAGHKLCESHLKNARKVMAKARESKRKPLNENTLN